jgi:hypothetical protein
MQEKEQRRLPDIEIMSDYLDSGPGEECCDLCGHIHQHGQVIARFDSASAPIIFLAVRRRRKRKRSVKRSG